MIFLNLCLPYCVSSGKEMKLQYYHPILSYNKMQDTNIKMHFEKKINV